MIGASAGTGDGSFGIVARAVNVGAALIGAGAYTKAAGAAAILC